MTDTNGVLADSMMMAITDLREKDMLVEYLGWLVGYNSMNGEFLTTLLKTYFAMEGK